MEAIIARQLQYLVEPGEDGAPWQLYRRGGRGPRTRTSRRSASVPRRCAVRSRASSSAGRTVSLFEQIGVLSRAEFDALVRLRVLRETMSVEDARMALIARGWKFDALD
jgi:hypothetical protein